MRRNAIVFHLAPIANIGQHEPLPLTTESRAPLEALRKVAYEAFRNTQIPSARTAAVIYRARSQAVKTYVITRANGACECCGKPAPFKDTHGEPYLEPHHTHRLADGGPDSPAWVGAICPNCHREIHYGLKGQELNAKLQTYLNHVEAHHV
jgi:5-methylcytosine-specific restriction protein A